MSREIRIIFPELSSARKTRAAGQLSDVLRNIKEIDSAVVLRERQDTQDAGTIISMILSAPAVAIAIKAISSWAGRSNQGRISILNSNGEVLIENLDSKDMPLAIKNLELFLKPKSKG